MTEQEVWAVLSQDIGGGEPDSFCGVFPNREEAVAWARELAEQSWCTEMGVTEDNKDEVRFGEGSTWIEAVRVRIGERMSRDLA